MLAVVGDLIEDIVVWPEGPLRRGTDNPARIFRTRGGSAANVAAFAASAYPTRFIGCVGDDAAGTSLVDQLTASGVDVRVQRRGVTGTIVILIESDGERTMMPQRGAVTLLEDVDPRWAQSVELLHVPSYSFDGSPLRESSEALIALAKDAGGLISVDASSTHVIEKIGTDAYRRLIQHLRCDFFIANEDEAEMLGLWDAPQTSEMLRQNPSTTFVVKAGALPTRVLRSGEEPLLVPVAPIEEVRDSTGAGDAFASGFLTSYLMTRDLRVSCEGGHSFAASVLRSPGATATITTIP